jgi:hypothetical protein
MLITYVGLFSTFLSTNTFEADFVPTHASPHESLLFRGGGLLDLELL